MAVVAQVFLRASGLASRLICLREGMCRRVWALVVLLRRWWQLVVLLMSARMLGLRVLLVDNARRPRVLQMLGRRRALLLAGMMLHRGKSHQ